MAGKSRPMSQIKQLIRLKQQGYAIKAIACCLSLSKNTVKIYLFKIGQAKLNMNELLELEDPILDGLLNAGNPAYRDARFEDFKERLSYFQQELSRPGVTRVNFFGKNISRACRTATNFHSSVSTWGNISKYRSAARWSWNIHRQINFISTFPARSFIISMAIPVRS